MEIKTLAKNTVILASPKVLNFFVGLIRTKLIAVFLGVTGLGIIDQLINTINKIRILSLSFLPDGMVKLIAEQNSQEIDLKKITSIIKTYFVMVIPLAIFMTILGYILADEITVYIFGSIEYKTYFLIGFTAFPITIFSASFRSLLKAYKEIKSFALVEILVIIINLILFVPLIYYYRVMGGVIYATLSFFVTFFVVLYVVDKNVLKKNNIKFSAIIHAVFEKKYFKELMAFISVGVVAGAFRIFEIISVRAIVVNELGIDKLGVYSPITKWGSLFIGFILPSIYTYLYPRLSEAKDNKDIINVVNDVIRLLTFVILPFIIIGISTREWIIPLFYSKDFMEATIYLPYHFAGLLLVVWGTIFEQIFAPTGRLKIFLLFIVVLNSLSLGLVYYLVPIVGLYGYLAKFTIIPLLTLLVFSIFWKNEINFRLKRENIFVILYAVLCCVILILMKDLSIYLQLVSLSLIFPMVFLLNKKEKGFLIKKIKSFI